MQKAAPRREVCRCKNCFVFSRALCYDRNNKMERSDPVKKAVSLLLCVIFCLSVCTGEASALWSSSGWEKAYDLDPFGDATEDYYLGMTQRASGSYKSSSVTDGALEDNAILAEFEKYDLLKPFWQQCGLVFGYADAQPTLTKLVMTMFVTYAQKSIHADLPHAWEPFVSFKSGTIIAFIDNLMNSVLYRERFDELSEVMYKALDAENQFSSMPLDALVEDAVEMGTQLVSAAYRFREGGISAEELQELIGRRNYAGGEAAG